MLEYSVYCTDYFSSWQGQIVRLYLRAVEGEIWGMNVLSLIHKMCYTKYISTQKDVST